MMYLYLKFFHIIAVVAWFAGLFYLPRLFIYHQAAQDEIGIQRFRIMERRLYYAIMWPSAMVTTLFGIGLILKMQMWTQAPWLHYKLLFVVGVWLYHFYCGRYLKILRKEKLSVSDRFLRIYNEIPTLLLTGIVWLVVFKP